MYRVEIKNSVYKQISRLAPDIGERLLVKALALANNPRPPGCKKLVARNEWRISVNDWRIIYEIHDKVLIVVVVRVTHRSIAYRDR
jgi:mRNA interferase RelE/StbE